MTTATTAAGKFVWHEQVSLDPNRRRRSTELFGWESETFGESDYTMTRPGAVPRGFGHGRRGRRRRTGRTTFGSRTSTRRSSGPGRLRQPLRQPGRHGGSRPDGRDSATRKALVCSTGRRASRPTRRVFDWADSVHRRRCRRSGSTGRLRWTTSDLGRNTRLPDLRPQRRRSRTASRGPMNPSRGDTAHWPPYVAVEDPDATVAKARELGASVVAEPMDVPGVGRFAILDDP